MRKYILRMTFLSLGLLFSVLSGWAAVQYPLRSLSPITTPHGVQRVRLGLDYNNGERLLFQTADKDREVYQLPGLDFAFGISSNVEFLFSYPMLYLKQQDQRSNYGSGDLTFTSVFNVITEKKMIPEGAFKLSVKLPNADDLRGFGTDQTDFFLGGVFLKGIGKSKWLMNTDFAILGNPLSTETKQDDVLIYSFGVLYPFGDVLAAGIEMHGTEFSRFGNDRRFLRTGFVYSWKQILIDLGADLGLTHASGDFQVHMGITFRYGVEKMDQQCY